MSGRQFFTESEKTCLQELIVKFKLNSSATIAAGNPAVKKAAWARLTSVFNSIETNNKRTESQLKKCWDNLKTRRKGALALEKRERMKTGGGPYNPQPSISTAVSQETIDDALLDATDVELQFAMDSDSVPNVDSGNLEESILLTLENPRVEDVALQNEETAERSTGQSATVQARSGHLSEVSQIVGGQAEQRDMSVVGGHAASQRGEVGRVRTTGRRSGSRLSDYDAVSSQAAGARNIRSQVINEEFLLRQQQYQRAQEREEELHKLKVSEREWLVKSAEEQYHKSCLEKQSAEELLRCSRAKREAAEIMLKNLKE